MREEGEAMEEAATVGGNDARSSGGDGDGGAAEREDGQGWMLPVVAVSVGIMAAV